jgi:hypothetical protein
MSSVSTRASARARRQGNPAGSAEGVPAHNQLGDDDHKSQKAPEGNADEDQLEETQIKLTESSLKALLTKAIAETLAATGRKVEQQPSGPTPEVRMSPAQSPRLSPVPSPYVPQPPRYADLHLYDGTGGSKLDDWIGLLRRLSAYSELSDERAVKYASSHFSGSAEHWWRSLPQQDKDAINSLSALESALAARFQPVTAEETAREALHELRQDRRSTEAYIADFQRLNAVVQGTSDKDRLWYFMRGLRQEIKEKLTIAGAAGTLVEAIAAAARIGHLTDGPAARSASTSSAPPHRAHQMEAAEPPGADIANVRLTRIEATLNAMAYGRGDPQPQGGFMGLGAKAQTKRGYQQADQAGTAKRGPQRQPWPVPRIPGVSPEVVQQRRDANLCLRCGKDGHRGIECPGVISAN